MARARSLRPSWCGSSRHTIMDRYWRQFNRTYIVVYKPERQATVTRILGTDMDDAAMRMEHAISSNSL